jgi:dTDP-glucose 4,6-dehydratase
VKILVSGGAGFIGSHLINLLLKKNYKVINTDKLTYAGNLENLSDCIQNKNYSFYQIDICNRDQLEKIFIQEQPEAVFHLAAESHVDRSIDCAEQFIQTNIVGTYTILDTCKKYFTGLNSTAQQKFRFINVSTDEVFGALSIDDGKFNETMPYRPNSPYAASKAAADLLARSYFKTYDLPIITVNSSNNYGPRQYPEKLIPLIIFNALSHKMLPIYGDGQQVRDWLFVEDNVAALVDILKYGQVGESYCVGSDNEITNLSLIEKICQLLDEIKPIKSNKLKSYKDLISFVKDRPGHDFRYATDATKLRNHTGWHAKISFSTGLNKTINWYIQQYAKEQVLI